MLYRKLKSKDKFILKLNNDIESCCIKKENYETTKFHGISRMGGEKVRLAFTLLIGRVVQYHTI